MEEYKEITQIKELEELEKKRKEVNEIPDRYRNECKVEPVALTESELEEYSKLSDEEKQAKYSKDQQEVTEELIRKYEEANREDEELAKQINVKAIEAYKAVIEEMKNIEAEIEENNKQLASLDEQIKELNAQIEEKKQALEQMVSVEGYDKEEYARLEAELGELKNELNVKEKIKEVKTKTNDKYKDQLEVLQSTKENLMEEYPVVLHHMEIEDLTEKWREIESTRKEKFKEYNQLKETEKYKNKDEETLKKANQLAKEIMLANDEESKIANKQKELNKLINELTGREAPVVSFQQKDKDVPISEQEIQEQQEDSTKLANSQDEKKDMLKAGDKEKSPNGKEKSNKAQVIGIAPNQIESTEQQKEDKKEIDPQEEFDELCYKARRGELKGKQFDRLVEIMKDPNSYEKLGITTGIIFNNSRRIFKALEKHNIGKIEGLSNEIKGEFAKELVGNSSGKKLLTKIAELDKEGLTEAQQATLEKVKLALNRQETLEQAKYVRDRIALEKNEKRWSWLIDFSEERERLSEPKKTKTEKTTIGEIGELSKLKKSERESNEFNRTYQAPTKGVITKDTKEH